MEIKPIAYIHNSYKEKFGIPRQGALADEIESSIVFEKEYRSADAVRGLEGFSHLWLIWEFSEIKDRAFRPTVRPPRLGGNKKVGVFASRSPYRPNSLGLSCVKIKEIDTEGENAPVIKITGADLLCGTPIYDIKPYIPMSDCFPEAKEGYTAVTKEHFLSVIFSEKLKCGIDEETIKSVTQLISDDPRPGYSDDKDRIYYICYGDYEFAFRVSGNEAEVCGVKNCKK